MSRLDSFIARMQAQRDCLNFLKPAVDALPGPILEIGTHKGRSTVLLATARRDSGRDGLVVTMDISHEFLAEARETIAAAGLGSRVLILQGTREALAGAVPPMTPGLVFVDGDHTYEGVARDLAALEPIVPSGGVIAMHDFGGYEADDPFEDR